jgi:hypothetical protein
MKEGTPNSPSILYCFGLFTHITLNWLLSQVYRARIAGPSSSTLSQVQPEYHGVWGASTIDLGCMREGTPNSPLNFYCFVLFTHITLNRLLPQVYRAHIAGPSSSTPQVSPTWISWRLGGIYHQFRTIDAWGGEPQFSLEFLLFCSLHSHCLELIVVAGLLCSYRRTILINTSGESNLNIMAFGLAFIILHDWLNCTHKLYSQTMSKRDPPVNSGSGSSSKKK